MTCPASTHGLFTQGFVADPYATYAALREKGPVHRVTLPGGIGAWLVTDYAECRRIFLDNEAFSKNLPGTWQAYREGQVPLTGDVVIGLGDSMLVSDPPRHTRLRSLVAKGFTPRRVAALEGEIAACADRLLEGLSGRAGPGDGHADLTREFSALIPMEVICALLGVPASDGEHLRTAVEAVMSNDEGSRDRAMAAFEEVHDYLRELVRHKTDRGGDDLTTALTEVCSGDDHFTEDELVAMLGLLLSAGHETTVNLIGSTVLALLRHPSQLEILRREPDRWPDAVEEVLRWDGPIQNAIWRFTRQPVTIGGTTLPAGEPVALSTAAADRDPARFPQGETFDVCRKERGHLAFGHGIHHCLGAPLARLEARIAVPRAFERLPGLRLAAEPTYRPSTVSRALTELPVVFGSEGHVASQGAP